ncbi:MAG: hypothetical protein IJD82_04665 [Clostridia bacterium]|nr:hypothetical protein [Clostridia bacterium]
MYNKHIERYFKDNRARFLYISSIASLVICIFLYHNGSELEMFSSLFTYLIPLVPFLMPLSCAIYMITDSMQISDKELDELAEKKCQGYLKEKVNGTILSDTKVHSLIIYREMLNADDFTFFEGYVKHTPDSLFKRAGDGRLRTPYYYATALSVTQDNLVVFETVFDLIEGTTAMDRLLFTDGAEAVDFSYEKGELTYVCHLKISRFGTEDELVFYLPINDMFSEMAITKIRYLYGDLEQSNGHDERLGQAFRYCK